jgi:hypothetical protein
MPIALHPDDIPVACIHCGALFLARHNLLAPSIHEASCHRNPTNLATVSTSTTGTYGTTATAVFPTSENWPVWTATVSTKTNWSG